MTWRTILDESPILGRGAAATYRDVPCRTVIGPTRAGSGDPRRALNPYVDCELACPYCVGHQLNERRGVGTLGAVVGAKTGAPGVVRRELARRPEALVVVGTATDPYQPLERRLGLTRRVLEEVAAAPGVPVEVATKSDLVTRDLPVLRRLADEGRVRVVVSLATTDGPLSRSLEPRAPDPRARLAAVERLAAAGVPVGLAAAPVLPGITSSSRELRRLVCAAAQAGARFFRARVLTLPPAARGPFLTWLAGERPELVATYRRWYRHDLPPPRVRERVEVTVAALRRQYRLASDHPLPGEPPPSAQLTLFDPPRPRVEGGARRSLRSLPRAEAARPRGRPVGA